MNRRSCGQSLSGQTTTGEFVVYEDSDVGLSATERGRVEKAVTWIRTGSEKKFDGVGETALDGGFERG